MATIAPGDPAPSIEGTFEDAGGSPHALADALGAGPVVLAIYKSSCQASKTVFPFLERLHQRHGGDGLTVLGVSQDSANVTRSFARRAGVSFPILIEPDGYPISRAFAITATPTIFLLKDGAVSYATMGFFKDPLNELGHVTAGAVGVLGSDLFTEADAGTPIFVPG